MIAVRSGKTLADRSRNESGVSGWKLAGVLPRSRSYGLMRVALDGPARGVVPDTLGDLRALGNRRSGRRAGARQRAGTGVLPRRWSASSEGDRSGGDVDAAPCS